MYTRHAEGQFVLGLIIFVQDSQVLLYMAKSNRSLVRKMKIYFNKLNKVIKKISIICQSLYRYHSFRPPSPSVVFRCDHNKPLQMKIWKFSTLRARRFLDRTCERRIALQNQLMQTVAKRRKRGQRNIQIIPFAQPLMCDSMHFCRKFSSFIWLFLQFEY